MYISDPVEVTLGPLVINIVDNFDTDPEIRFKVLSVACRDSAYPLERWAVEKLPTSLRGFVTGFWLREMAIGYLDLIDIIVSKLRGENRNDSGIIPPEEAVKMLAMIEDGTPEWLESHEIRKKVEALRKAIIETIHWFDLQFVSMLLLRVPASPLFSLDFPQFLDTPEAFRPVQLKALADLGHHKGSSMFRDKVGTAYIELQSARGPERLKKLFEITKAQLRLLALQRRGAKISAIQFEEVGVSSTSVELE